LIDVDGPSSESQETVDAEILPELGERDDIESQPKLHDAFDGDGNLAGPVVLLEEALGDLL
jgi:hypothetical protein